MGESLALAAMSIDGGFARRAAAMTSSHFCTAERQYRMPVPYGSQRTPTAQWTATAAGCCILSNEGRGPAVTHAAIGRIVATAASRTRTTWAQRWRPRRMTRSARSFPTHAALTPRTTISSSPAISAGSGTRSSRTLFARDGVDMTKNYKDCGLLLYDLERQDMHMGGSGCGCSAAVLNGYLLRGMREGKWNRIIFAPTGALLSPTSTMQGGEHPGRVPRRHSGKHRGGKLMDYLNAFLCGGILCAVGQILIDKTPLTPARILTGYVVAGVLLTAVGVYEPIVEWGGAGATVPLTGFGYSLASGVKKAVAEQGWLGVHDRRALRHSGRHRCGGLLRGRDGAALPARRQAVTKKVPVPFGTGTPMNIIGKSDEVFLRLGVEEMDEPRLKARTSPPCGGRRRWGRGSRSAPRPPRPCRRRSCAGAARCPSARSRRSARRCPRRRR